MSEKQFSSDDPVNDPIYERFMQRQLEEGMELARSSDSAAAAPFSRWRRRISLRSFCATGSFAMAQAKSGKPAISTWASGFRPITCAGPIRLRCCACSRLACGTPMSAANFR